MLDLKKKIRFLFWFSLEFFKKNLLWIALGFASFLVGILLLVLFKPLLSRFFFGIEKIGVVGVYSYNNPPEEILSLISRPILAIDKKGQVVPILLTQWEMKEGGKVFRFYFRKDLVWNDGKPFSVDDIAGSLFKDATLKTIDNYTLEVKLKNPTLILPYYLRRPVYRYPLIGLGGEYDVAKVKLKEGRFEEVILSSKLSNNVKIYRFYNTEAQLVNAFKTGKVDRFVLKDKELISELQKWRNIKITQEVDFQNMAVIFFNLKNELLAQKSFRDGISFILPWERLKKEGELSKGPIPPNSEFYFSGLPTKVYDEEKGLELIKNSAKEASSEAANKNLLIKADYRLSDLAEELSDKLSRAGIKTQVEILTAQVEGDFDILIVFWKIPLEVDQYFFWHSTQTQAGNITGYKNLRIDKYLEDARSTFSFEKQYIALKKFQEEIVRDKPAIFLFFPYKYLVERKRLF